MVHSRKPLLTLGVVACLGGQLAWLGHQALVRHVVCAEHGDLIDATGGSIEHSAAKQSVASLRTGATGSHDHCQAAVLRRASSLERAAVVVAAPPPSFVRPPSLHRVAPASQIAAIFLAPKASPPA